jgi:hypothetical protein
MKRQALSVIANLLLVWRFSKRAKPILTNVSSFLWVIKTAVEIVNLSVFGHRDNAWYDEGICKFVLG